MSFIRRAGSPFVLSMAGCVSLLLLGTYLLLGDERSSPAESHAVASETAGAAFEPSAGDATNHAAGPKASDGNPVDAQIQGLPADPADITTLTAEQAEALLQRVGEGGAMLCLDGLIDLSPDVAEVLAKHRRGMSLNGLTKISSEVAQSLKRHSVDLDLNGLVEVSDETGAALANKGGHLSLDGLTTLSLETAQAFARHEWVLSLNGLKDLSRKKAAALANKSSGTLELNGLATLSDASVENIAKCKAPLHLGLLELSPAAAVALASAECGELYLDGLTSLSDTAAEALAKYKESLSLNGLTTLSDRAAESLARHKGYRLSLDGLTVLSDKAAESLAKRKSSLSLDGLTTLSDNAADALAKHRGALTIGSATLTDAAIDALVKRQDLLCLGLTSLSPRQAKALSENAEGLCFHKLPAISGEAAAALARSDEDLEFGSLSTLSAEAAEGFANHEGHLRFRRLATLSPEAAQALAKHRGILHLPGLTTLPDKAAEALAKHKDSVNLYWLEMLSEAAASSLRANPKIILPMSWKTISEKEAEGMASSSQPNTKPSKGAAAASSPSIKKLADVLVRVPRGGKVNPGRRIQAAQRLVKVDNIDADSSLGRMLDAYHSGVGEWRMADGKVEKMSAMGLASVNWAAEKAFPAWKSPHPDEESFVDVKEEASGVRVTLEPTAVTDELLCSISFIVLSDTPANTRAEELDYLAGQVELFGGKYLQLESSPLIQPDTIVDFWSQTKRTRCTISHWKDNDPAGHIAAHTYGPLLFEVVNSEPEFMLLENVKIELSPQFRAGCRGLCDKVLELRKKQGQSNPPMCRDVPGQPVP